MRKHSINPYPDDWQDIAEEVKKAAGWRCVRCNHPHNPKEGYCLTVHHLDLNPANNHWWNLAALCQRCHLKIQNRIDIHQFWMFGHTEWFKPYVAGHHAFIVGLPDNKKFVSEHLEDLIDLNFEELFNDYPISKTHPDNRRTIQS